VTGKNEFELNDDDLYAVEVAQNVGRKLMRHSGVSGERVAGLRHALEALERLPLATPGAACEFAVVYRDGTEESSEMRYIQFRIPDSIFEISKGASVYDKSVGE
jgi:hypothetical protein